jgi:hypothetical protein
MERCIGMLTKVGWNILLWFSAAHFFHVVVIQIIRCGLVRWVQIIRCAILIGSFLMELLNLHVLCKRGLISRCCFSRHIVQTYIFVPKGEFRLPMD